MVTKIKADVHNTVAVVQVIDGQNSIKTLNMTVNGKEWLCLVIR